jgi:hypothetical protein
MRAAVVDLATNIVTNVIVADATVDVAPGGCTLVDVDNLSCEIGWVYDPVVVDFIDPNPMEPEQTPSLPDVGA